ncbi:hypothetical protein BD410DRAFT_733639 [Rickenella mellea]|uniref:Thioesterase/thiol ester dehydrase-isomerase n=1 Tax=Rickenella mellea TaxID=50990 RepID=A0A4Y7PH43_9AGAM|nr:hypothetical protein BD410DRAFT_733639 [Rickenella mellea]
MRELLGPSDKTVTRSILPWIPRPLKWLALLILLVNARNLPFIWHVRVFRPALYLRLKWYSLVFSSRATKRAWLESLAPVGKSPFEVQTSSKTWASPDDCDFNWHLSNSSYAKNLDSARLKYALATLSPFFRDGGWVALGATHFDFIKEIPMFAEYEIRLHFVGWDQKWAYLIAQFVTTRKQKDGRPKTTSSTSAEKITASVSSSLDPTPTPILPELHTPVSGSSTPIPRTHRPALSLADARPSSSNLVNTVPSTSAFLKEGETLHAVALSHVCYKYGRITIPPALVFASVGFCLSEEQWTHVSGLRQRRELVGLMKGGWKDVPESERWWDAAMGKVEGQRIANSSVVRKVRDGIEGARSL